MPASKRLSILVLLLLTPLMVGATGAAGELVAWLLNIDSEELPAGSPWRTEFHWLPHSWQVFAVLGAALAAFATIVFLYIKEASDLSPFKRLSLAFCRVVALVVAFVVLTGPNLRAVHQIENDSVFLVLVDQSASMSIADQHLGDTEKTELSRMTGLGVHEIPSTSRAALVDQILTNDVLKVLDRLADRNDIRIYTFDGSVHDRAAYGKGETPAWEPLAAGGLSTDLSTGIQSVLDRQEGNTEIAGLLVVTDGQFNQGPPPFSVAKAAGQREIPIWVLGLGDIKSPRSVALLDFLGPERAFVAGNDPAAIDPVRYTAVLKQQGMSGSKLDLVLEVATKGTDDFLPVATEDGNGGRTTVEFDDAGGQPEVAFLFKPSETGEFEYRIRIDDPKQLGKDVTVRQASLRKTLRVIDRENRVLLVSGTANYEYRILKNLLIREAEISLSLWLQSATKGWPQRGNEVLTELPLDFEKLRTYDLLILIDPNPRDFTPERIEAIEKFLTREGGGLIFVCGEAYTHQLFTDSSMRGILDLMPVKPDADPMDLVDIGTGYSKEWQVQVPEGESVHEILLLADDERDHKELIASLLPFYWYFKVAEAKPLSQILLVRVDPEDGLPVGEHSIVTAFGFHGPGRVLFSATDSTYLWRSIDEIAYQRYWLNSIRYLMQGRLFGGQKRAKLTMTGEAVSPEGDRFGVPLGGKVTLRATALDTNFVDPLPDDELLVELQHRETKERWNVTLQGIENRPGEYEGTFHPARTGQHMASIMGFPEEEAAGRELIVREPRGEVDTPELNRTALVSILQMNREGLVDAGVTLDESRDAFVGSHYLDQASEVATFPDDVESKIDQFQLLGKRQEIWSSPLVILVFVLFVGLEWFFRKRANLV